MIIGWRGAFGLTGTAEVGSADHRATPSTRASRSARPTSAMARRSTCYATDFHNGRIDVFDRTFAWQTGPARSATRNSPRATLRSGSRTSTACCS